MRILLSFLKNRWYSRKSCSTSTRRNSNNIDVSRRVMGLCNGVILPLAERARQDGRWQDTMRGVTYDGPWFPCGATFSLKPTSSKAEPRLQQFGKRMLHGILMGYVLRARGGWSGELAHRGLRRPEKRSDFESCVKKFKHQDTKKSPKKETLSFSCADGFLKLSVLPRPHGERRAGRNLEQDEKAESDHPSKKKTERILEHGRVVTSNIATMK